jgi:hypothetical protein
MPLPLLLAQCRAGRSSWVTPRENALTHTNDRIGCCSGFFEKNRKKVDVLFWKKVDVLFSFPCLSFLGGSVYSEFCVATR